MTRKTQTDWNDQPHSTGGDRRERSLGPLDPTGAFVIRFCLPAGAERRSAGKVEHVPSGEELQFRSRQELLDFLTRAFPGRPSRR